MLIYFLNYLKSGSLRNKTMVYFSKVLNIAFSRNILIIKMQDKKKFNLPLINAHAHAAMVSFWVKNVN